mmetsp:Transcript_27202/g.61406  ORF Transcript_27202/g.61406 Transcript_27202/m.61406 type:complete len:332 (-) Transcript_27202:75-1070(-)
MDPSNGGGCTEIDFLGVKEETTFPFIHLPFDGIFGLGLSGLSVGNNFNFLARLKGLPQVFTAFVADPKVDEATALSFGAVRHEWMASPVQWAPIQRDWHDVQGYWMVGMTKAVVHGTTPVALAVCDDATSIPRCKVAVDTGSSLLMGPREGIELICSTLAVANDCSNFDALPSLEFEIVSDDSGGTISLVLEKELYVERNDNGCAVRLHPLDVPASVPPMWVFGHVVLQKYATVYDAEHRRIGFALAKHKAGDSSVIPFAATSCSDDDAGMKANNLPGCVELASESLCSQFEPVARRFCQRSCGFCVRKGVKVATNGGFSLHAPSSRSIEP